MKSLRAIGSASIAGHEAAAKLDTLEDVLRWGAHVVEVVVQDEYTHDVIAQHAGGFLVFDTT